MAKGLDWHTAFYVAMQAELVNYLPELSFEREHYLTAQPLRMDILIIKKKPEVIIDKHIAEHFKGYNVIEYKSPDDSLTYSDYLKVIGYACIYQALEHIPIHDITLTMVCSKEPVQLVKTLCNDDDFRITEKYPGIYEIGGEHFPVRVVVSKKLSLQDNIWIKNLNKGLTTAEVLQIKESSRRINQRINMDAYLDVFIKANIERLRKEVSDVGFEIFREWLEEFGWDKKWVEQTQGERIEKIKAEVLAEGKAKGLAEGKAEGLAEGKAEGLTEGKAKGLAEGKAKGLEASLHLLQALKQNEPIESIAERYEQPVSQIILYRDILFSSNVTAV
jgi:hypothetical protein